jgi:hypothetical protein
MAVKARYYIGSAQGEVDTALEFGPESAEGNFNARRPDGVAHKQISNSQRLLIHCTRHRDALVAKTKAPKVLHGCQRPRFNDAYSSQIPLALLI